MAEFSKFSAAIKSLVRNFPNIELRREGKVSMIMSRRLGCFQFFILMDDQYCRKLVFELCEVVLFLPFHCFQTVSVQKFGISGPLLEEPSGEQPQVFFGDVNLVALKPKRPTVSEYSRLLMRAMYMDEKFQTHMLYRIKAKRLRDRNSALLGKDFSKVNFLL